MSSKQELIQALKEVLQLKTLNESSIQELRQLLDALGTLSDEEWETIYRDIGGLSERTTIGAQSLERLPYPVAILLQETNKARNDLVRLLFLNETVECFVRWRLAETLSILHHERGFQIPDGLLGDLSTKILRPSMGTWVGGLERIAKQIQSNEQTWGVAANMFLKDIAELNDIVKMRNKVAHGEVMRDITVYLQETITKAEALFESYAALNIQHFVQVNDKLYEANGPVIHPSGQSLTLTAVGDQRIDQRTSYYLFTKAEQPVLQIPCTFVIVDIPPTINGLSHPFSTGTFISSHKECRTVTAGGELVYNLVDGKEKHEDPDLQNFVRLFKTDIKLMANEPWKGLFEELGGSAAWNVDRALIKHHRLASSILAQTGPQTEIQPIERPKEIPNGKVWYFGGGPEAGKSTLLFSYLKNASSGGVLSFPYRFALKTDGLTIQDLVDDFFRHARDAFVFWLRQNAEVPTPDEDLVGEDLYNDATAILEKLLSTRENVELIIGLDDLHHLYDPSTEEQILLETFLTHLAKWGVFAHEATQTTYNRAERRQEFDNQYRRQVFILAAGMDMGDDKHDIDNLMASHHDVAFLYHPDHIEAFYPKENLEKPSEDASSRERELHNNPCRPEGAHMPPIDAYGAVEIMTENGRNKNFGRHMKLDPPGLGHQFIADTLNTANRNPIIIDAIAQNLDDGVIEISDPVTEQSFTKVSQGPQAFYLQNTSYVIPLLLCFMELLQVPLTTATLQILCSDATVRNPTLDKWISQALHTIPHHIEKVNLSAANADGTLAIGWRLRPNKSNLVKDLEMVRVLAKGRIAHLIDHLAEISDALQLKSVLQENARRRGINLTVPSANPVRDIFAELQGALTPKIRQTLQQFAANAVLQSSADMLYQTAVIAPASITWLQKASESHALHTAADGYTQSPAFNEFWLKHVNVERTPIFEHEIKAAGYPEKISKVTPINEDYFLTLGVPSGSTKDKPYNSIAIYHHQRTQPDYTLLSADTTDQAIDCVVLGNGEYTIVAIAIETKVHVHLIHLTDRARPWFQNQSPIIHVHDYQEDIKGLIAFSDCSIGVFGTRVDDSDDKTSGWGIDILSKITTDGFENSTLISVGGTKKGNAPKFSLATGQTQHITYGKEIVELDSTTCSPRYPTHFVSAAEPLTFTQGCIVQKGSKANNEAAWYSNIHHTSVKLKNQTEDDTFAKIIFATPIESKLLTVDYLGVLRVYTWNQPTPICEIPLNIPALHDKARTVNGGLIHGTRLLLYGSRSFMAFYDVADILKTPKSAKNPNQQIDLSLHFGAIKGAIPIEGSFNDHHDLFITWSEDNDLRLWSWSSGTKEDPDGFGLGLFRGHNAKVKDVQPTGEILISFDEKQNLRTWRINQGVHNQLTTLPQQAPAYINNVCIYDKHAWSISTESDDIFIEKHPNLGAQWTEQSALLQQQVGILEGSLSSSTLIDHTIVLLLRSKEMFLYDLNKQRCIGPLTYQDAPLSISGWHQHDKGLLLYNKQTIYQMDTNFQLTHRYTTPDDQAITTAHQVGGDIYYAVTITTQIVNEKGKKKKDESHKEICHLASNSKQPLTLTQITADAKIGGLSCIDKHILFWVESTNLQLYWYDIDHQKLSDALTHPLLAHRPSSIHRIAQGNGFSFKSGDNDRRWTLRLDYPLVEHDTVSLAPVFLLDSHQDWLYAGNHHTEMLQAYHDKSNCLPAIQTFAETSPFGVIIHYDEGQRLLWTGDSIRDFKLATIQDTGQIVLYKNRSIIALQLMQGSNPVPFSALPTVKSPST